MTSSGPRTGVPRETDEAVTAAFGERSALIARYAAALTTTGVERGLIGPREVPRIWDRHILNCVAVESVLPQGATVVDVGSGAGLPGLVVAIARPDVSVTLLEPLLRRVTWLDEVVEELGLRSVRVVRDRAEDFVRTGERFDVATARAVAPLSSLVGWCLPLVRAGGHLLALKGESAAAEVDDAAEVIERLGGAPGEVIGLGTGTATTTVVRIHKVREPEPTPRGGVAGTRRQKRGGRRRG